MPTARNVIILHCDELRGDCTGFAGNTEVLTPHLDAFAEESLVLDRHFTVHGKCVPSRVAMMTGRYAHSNGSRTVMEEDLIQPDQHDLMKTLAKHGFETAVFGLNHCWADFYHGNQPHGVVDWHSFIEGDFHAITTKAVTAPSPGSRADVPCLRDGFDLQGRLTGILPRCGDDTCAQATIHYLKTIRNRDRPCFLQMNLGAPHPPYRVEEPWFSLYDPKRLTLFPQQLPRHSTLPLRAQRIWRTGQGDIPETSLREVLATYYGMISKVDALMGQVLACIRELNLFDDSIVIMTSDHGDFAGQYGLCEKFDTVLADCLLRVPCIIHAPGLPRAERRSVLTQHIDLPPTILALLGVEPDPAWNLHGASLLPLIAGTGQRDEIFADGGHEAAMRHRFNAAIWQDDPITGARHQATAGKQHTYANEPESMARCSMVRTSSHKLVMRETGEHELYALLDDPWELNNLYPDPGLAEVRLELMEGLVRWHLRTLRDQPFHPRVVA